MALCLKQDWDFAVEDGGRRKRCFSLLLDQRMMFSCPRPLLFPQNCWEEKAGSGLPELERCVSQAGAFGLVASVTWVP